MSQWQPSIHLQSDFVKSQLNHGHRLTADTRVQQKTITTNRKALSENQWAKEYFVIRLLYILLSFVYTLYISIIYNKFMYI